MLLGGFTRYQKEAGSSVKDEERDDEDGGGGDDDDDGVGVDDDGDGGVGVDDDGDVHECRCEIVESYDVDTWERRREEDLPQPRAWHAVAELEGRIYVMGGNNGFRHLRDVEFLSSSTSPALLPSPTSSPLSSSLLPPPVSSFSVTLRLSRCLTPTTSASGPGVLRWHTSVSLRPPAPSMGASLWREVAQAQFFSYSCPCSSLYPLPHSLSSSPTRPIPLFPFLSLAPAPPALLSSPLLSSPLLSSPLLSSPLLSSPLLSSPLLFSSRPLFRYGGEGDVSERRMGFLESVEIYSELVSHLPPPLLLPSSPPPLLLSSLLSSSPPFPCLIFSSDPRKDTWRPGPPLPVQLARFSLVEARGRIFAVGGCRDGRPQPSVFSLDPRERSAAPADLALASCFLL
eukprot:766626-Hanusia_phi.AAC.1